MIVSTVLSSRVQMMGMGGVHARRGGRSMGGGHGWGGAVGGTASPHTHTHIYRHGMCGPGEGVGVARDAWRVLRVER